MLPREHRLTRSVDFRTTVRAGERAGTRSLVVHARTVRAAPGAAPDSLEATQVGLVVSKSVGSAVTRNRVKRRLRHLLRSRLASLPAGTVLVVRALPPAGRAGSAELGADLDSALRRLRGLPGAAAAAGAAGAAVGR